MATLLGVVLGELGLEILIYHLLLYVCCERTSLDDFWYCWGLYYN